MKKTKIDESLGPLQNVIDLDDVDLDELEELEQEEKAKEKKKKRRFKNIEYKIVSYAFFVLFISMSVFLCRYVALESEEVADNSFNARIAAIEKDMVRGNIVSNTGEVLAGSNVASDGSQTRVYPYSSMFAHVVGYTGHGKSGLEEQFNTKLISSHVSMLEREKNELNGIKNTGDTLWTTLDVNLQETAWRGMGMSDGAVVCIEPSTGKILAMMSKPDFNPNEISETYETYTADKENTVLLNRATQGLYPPGSTFKIFDTVEYLREANNPDSYSYNCGGKFTFNGESIKCYHGSVHHQVNLKQSFAKSCNGSFANIGSKLDIAEFQKTLDGLLFNSEMPTDFEYSKSTYELPISATANQIIQTSIGQGGTLVTPFHEALIASAICNNGQLMKPYLVDRIESKNGDLVTQFEPEAYKILFSPEESAKLTEYMRAVVESGTGNKLKSATNYTAYGKTGSAEFKAGSTISHSWFVGFAKNDAGKELALAIIYEKKGSGSEYAVPLAKQLFDAYFSEP